MRSHVERRYERSKSFSDISARAQGGKRRRSVTDGKRRWLTSRTSHIPASSWPATRQAIRKLPMCAATKEKVVEWWGDKPACAWGEAEPGNASAVVPTPRTIAHE